MSQFTGYDNVIQFVDSCKTHEDFFIITDFYNGGTLTKIITK